MVSESTQTPDRERDEAALRLLGKLKEQLCSSNASARRQAAFNLSWMQEDGLEILKEALFGNLPTPSKNAATYGLRKMRGRMKKMAINVLKQGLQHRERSTREVSRDALLLMGEQVPKRTSSAEAGQRKLRIKEIPGKNRPRGIYGMQPSSSRRRPGNHNDAPRR